MNMDTSYSLTVQIIFIVFCKCGTISLKHFFKEKSAVG